MGLHGNARLGLGGRRLLGAGVAAGYSCREAARRRGSPPTSQEVRHVRCLPLLVALRFVR